eukprot:CAMPEP_0113704636 /NCGR_PEP_ID=MMETSP0038_2-20120614/26637_1 /TAXON_ID=2898 /ORGANISM="Cryptomonas paramecium" /LENGTH=170 /DNA_ID=CAMNT_0000629455 /DNA_START=616 /DNA_END=1128 /DNA_ORIENTATION=- /assembly_acc=CAM_ASM_000170
MSFKQQAEHDPGPMHVTVQGHRNFVTLSRNAGVQKIQSRISRKRTQTCEHLVIKGNHDRLVSIVIPRDVEIQLLFDGQDRKYDDQRIVVKIRLHSNGDVVVALHHQPLFITGDGVPRQKNSHLSGVRPRCQKAHHDEQNISARGVVRDQVRNLKCQPPEYILRVARTNTG